MRYYYDVAIGSEKHWETGEFTYCSDIELAPHTVVLAPFGQKSKTGFITRAVPKPGFNVKPIILYDNVHLSDKTVAFITWYRQYYAAKPGQAYSQLLPSYLTKKLPKKLSPAAAPKQVKPPRLTAVQAQAKAQLLHGDKPAVLHGITGSGKTRLYLSLILDTLASGKSALLLYPEIALTSQILQELKTQAPVIAFHSSLTDAERSKLWFLVATATEPLVVVGPRSSLFLPHNRLGLILIDEAHESTYKQETDVHYNGLLVAGGLAKSHGAKLILGSATPPLTESELVIQGGGSLVCMHEQALQNDYDKQVHVIDRKNRTKFRRNGLIADELLDAIEHSLGRNKQSLLFINRRGTAKLTLCEQCGWQAECPACELPLTYHHDNHKLLCHTCGKTAAVQSICPDCGQPTSLKALGSKAIASEVQTLFPDAVIGRYDTDTDKEDSFAANYHAIREGKIDILIGTQQIAKGLDLPLLDTVGVLDADLSLHFPDFSSDERTFQLLAQVSGRVGRGHGSGTIYIQTLHPESTTIAFATREDWHGFRNNELSIRKAHLFPPYIFAAKLIFRDKNQSKAFKQADSAKNQLKSHTAVSVDGPLPAFHQKRSGHFYVHLHLRSRSRKNLLEAIHQIKEDSIIDLDPSTML